jgi:O-antigen ligase
MIIVYFLITLLPYQRHPLWSDLVGDLTMVKYVGVASLVYTIFYWFNRRRPASYFGTPHARWFIAFLGVCLLSFVINGAPFVIDAHPIVSYLSFFMVFWVILTVVDSFDRLRWVLLVAVGSVAWGSLYLIREWQKFGDSIRPGWIFGDSNYFTASAVLCVPVAFYLSREARPRWQQVFCISSITVIVFAVMIGASRGGFVALTAAIGLVTVREPRRLRSFTILVGGLLLFALVAPSSPITRFLEPRDIDAASADSRTVVWGAGLRMLEANPVLGIGIGNFKPTMRQFIPDLDLLPDGTKERIAHNMYVEIAAEMGLLGLGTLVGMMVWAFVSLQRTYRRARDKGAELVTLAALGLQAGLFGFAVSSFFLSAQTVKLFWLMLFVTMTLPGLLARAPQGRIGSGRIRARPRAR